MLGLFAERRKESGIIKKMDAIETRLITATIELGALRPQSQSFSLREIATKSGLSTYPIFFHYGGKEGLVNAAMDWILEAAIARFEEGMKPGESFAEKLHRLLEEGISHPSHVRFLMNYGLWFEKSEEDPKRLELAYRSGLTHGKKLLTLLGLTYDNDDTCFLVFCSLLRQLAYASLTILNGEAGEVQSYLATVSEEIRFGLRYFDEKEGKTRHG